MRAKIFRSVGAGLALKTIPVCRMNSRATTFGTSSSVAPQNLRGIETWLRDLSELQAGGLLNPEDFAIQRAEKLREILCPLRFLWLAPVVSAGSLGVIAGSITWAISREWQYSAMAAALAALFGLVMLTRPLRDNMKHAQTRSRLALLNGLLARDLISAEEFVEFEERLERGSNDLSVVPNL